MNSKLKDWARTNDVTFASKEEAVKDPKVKALYRQAVEQFNRSFNHIEQVKKFELMAGEWSVEGGELTPTMKLKRTKVMEKFNAEIDGMYAGH